MVGQKEGFALSRAAIVNLCIVSRLIGISGNGRVLYIFKRRGLVSEFSCFQFSYGVSLGMSFKHLSQYEAKGPASERGNAKVLALCSYRPTHVNKFKSFFYQASTSKELQLSSSMLVPRGTALSSGT